MMGFCSLHAQVNHQTLTNLTLKPRALASVWWGGCSWAKVLVAGRSYLHDPPYGC